MTGIYACTRIGPMPHTEGAASVFEIIAEPNRRAMLSLLLSSAGRGAERTLGRKLDDCVLRPFR